VTKMIALMSMSLDGRRTFEVAGGWDDREPAT
jgi:hypothetical protein